MSQKNVEVVRRLWAGLEEDPGMSWLDLCDEEMEITNPAEFPVQGPYRGHDGVRQWATENWEVFGDLHHEVEEVIEVGDGETIVSVQRTQGRMRHTRLETDVRWATVWTFRGGKAVRAAGYLSKAEALEIAGLQE